MISPDKVGGGSIPDVIRNTVSQATDSLPEIAAESPASDPARLIDALRQWLHNDDLVTPGHPVAFVVVESLRHLDGEEVLLLTTPGGRSLIPGSVYLCSRGLGKAVRVPGGESIDDLGGVIAGLGLSDRPTVVYTPVDAVFVWLPQGLTEPDDRLEERLDSSGRDVDGATVVHILDRAYLEHWRTPTAGGRIWHEAAARVPAEDTEAVFQADVFLACKLMFDSHRAITELSAVMGRCDVLLLPKSGPPSPQGRALIEMKVLRAFHFPSGGGQPSPVTESDNRKAVRKGTGQAYLYGQEHACAARILCLCDMRANDDDGILSRFESFATRHDVVTRRYFMYASADELREAILEQEGLPPA